MNTATTYHGMKFNTEVEGLIVEMIGAIDSNLLNYGCTMPKSRRDYHRDLITIARALRVHHSQSAITDEEMDAIDHTIWVLEIPGEPHRIFLSQDEGVQRAELDNLCRGQYKLTPRKFTVRT